MLELRVLHDGLARREEPARVRVALALRELGAHVVDHLVGRAEAEGGGVADVELQAENLFEQTIKSLAEQEQVTEKLKAENMMLWVQKMNNIRNRATEIVNEQVIYK